MNRHSAILLFLLWPLIGMPQTPVPRGLLTVATTTPGGPPWIYVRWKSTDGTLPFGTPFAVYLKNGAADAAIPLQFQGVALPAEEESLAGAQLSRAAALGTDMAALERDITGYSAVVAAGHAAPTTAPVPDNVSLATKLARLVHQARSGDTRTATGLQQMAVAHPAIALAIGEAWAGPISVVLGTPVTVELRSWDPVASVETGIAGRITVSTGQPETILAPGAPIQVPDHAGTGDRVVKLRWATPDPLRRQTPLVTGYSVYRVTPTAAQARGWLATPPAASALRSLAISNPADAKRLTDVPLGIGKPFNAVDVANFATAPPGDGITHYLVDDNDRYAVNAAGELIGKAFPDGTRHYYFAVGRDLLGREGAVSPAGEGTACARLSPHVPADFALFDETITVDGKTRQCFILRWKANVIETDNATDFYQLFRGSATEATNVDLANLSTLPAPQATLPHLPDAKGYMTWRDENLPQGVAGVTYWYVLRAVHTSPCPPGNFSGLTPQVYGTLRTSKAPPAPVAARAFQCPLAGLRMARIIDPYEFGTLPDAAVDDGLRTVRLIIDRTDRNVERIDIKWAWTGYTEPRFSRFEFPPEGNTLTVDFRVPAFDAAISFVAKSGSIAGSESATVTRTPLAAPNTTPGWAKDQALILRGRAAAPTLGEVTTANADHVEMFSLHVNAVYLTPVAAGGQCFSAPVGGSEYPRDDHKPFVVEAIRANGPWTTVTGAEIARGSLFFCDPLATDQPAPSTYYRAIPITTGATACIHYADGADGSIRGILLALALPPDFGEYRIFRRVDDGPLALIAQGDGRHLPTDAQEVVRMDDSIPATACTLRYFGQTFDKQGQSSPLVPIGDPILLGRRDVSVPILRTPRPGGTVAAPTMRLEWFCPPEGIERFRIRLDPEQIPSPKAEPPPPGSVSIEIMAVTRYIAQKTSISLYPLYRVANLSVLTGAVGEGQSLGVGPVFSLDLPVDLATRYKITLQAISVAGVNSQPSKEQVFTWNLPSPPPSIDDEPKVNWPKRPLPGAGFWHPLVRAELTKKEVSGGPPLYERWDIKAPGPFQDYPVGVRIAAQRALNRDLKLIDARPSDTQPEHFVATVRPELFAGTPHDYAADITTWLLPRRSTSALNAAGALVALTVDLGLASGGSSVPPAESLLPAVLYRRQVPSERFPTVSGATIQVSPMLAKIAAFLYNSRIRPAELIIRDPYIGVISREDSPIPNFNLFTDSLDLFLLDTQPVTKGARYHYTLVRFSAVDGEMLESIDAGELLIP